jgi:MFS transporter, MHS family, proline/betaine transporter
MTSTDGREADLTSTTSTAEPGTAAAGRVTVDRRSMIASMVGSLVEFYDFYVFGLLATVIAEVFFPATDPVAGLLYTFAVFGVAFVARPVGAALFGHFGDRFGRRNSLATAILLMVGATAAIGLAPTYAAVGVIAPLWLCVCRLLQGISTGGQIGGLLSYVTELAPAHRRGLYGALLPALSACGALCGTLVGALVVNTLDHDQLITWGFRLPFLIAVPLGLSGLFLRWGGAEETSSFRRQAATAKTRKPVVETFREHGRSILVILGVLMAWHLGGFLLVIYLPTYLMIGPGIAQSDAFLYGVFTAALWAVLLLPLGALSDRVGRRPVIIGGAAWLVVLTYPAFLLLDMGRTPFVLLGCTILIGGLSAVSAPAGALLTEQFPTRVRYSATGLAFAIGSSLFGGTAPFVGTFLVSSLDATWALVLYYVLAAGVTLVVTSVAIRETAGQDLPD